ncbi:MAG: hypothetical protein WKF94_00240 [Solirubrobacteraceae bacterium]
MTNDWRETILGELVGAAGGFIKTGPFGTQLHSAEYIDDPSGVPVVMPKDMARGRIDTTSIKRVPEDTRNVSNSTA